MNNVLNIHVGKPKATGGIRWSPIGVELPTDSTTPLPDTWSSAGFVSAGGLTKSINTSDEDEKAWGGATVKVLRTERGQEYSFEVLESANADTLKLLHGEDNVEFIEATAATSRKITIKQKNELGDTMQFCFDMMDKPANLREVIGLGIASVSGDVTYVDNATIKYAVTVKCLEDAEGVFATTYYDSGRMLQVAA